MRIPITADAQLFTEAVEIGKEIISLHTFGERFVSPDEGRPAGPPRLPPGQRPQVPAGGAIPSDADAMPESISYDPVRCRLHVGAGFIDNVSPAVWAYEVSGKQVLTQWFSYRGRDRSRPIIGDRRPPSCEGARPSPRRKPSRQWKQFFFEKKNQKTFASPGSRDPERPQPKQVKVFCFFFSKKKALLARVFRLFKPKEYVILAGQRGQCAEWHK